MNNAMIGMSLSLLISVSGSVFADNYSLTFDSNACTPNTCSNYSYISQSYGDVANVFDVTYSEESDPSKSLRWWDANYNDLKGVIWADSSDSDSSARIEIKALNGGLVTLNSMDFGAYPDTSRSTTITVWNADTGTQLFQYAGDIGSGALSHNTFSPTGVSAQRLWIEWKNSAYNVGIDNVNFSVTTIPEPETYAIFLAGLGLVGFFVRHRRND